MWTYVVTYYNFHRWFSLQFNTSEMIVYDKSIAFMQIYQKYHCFLKKKVYQKLRQSWN